MGIGSGNALDVGQTIITSDPEAFIPSDSKRTNPLSRAVCSSHVASELELLCNGLQAVTPESDAVANIKNNTLVQQLIRPVLIGG